MAQPVTHRHPPEAVANSRTDASIIEHAAEIRSSHDPRLTKPVWTGTWQRPHRSVREMVGNEPRRPGTEPAYGQRVGEPAEFVRPFNMWAQQWQRSHMHTAPPATAASQNRSTST